MNKLTADQNTALSLVENFMTSDATSFALTGGAGVGKSFFLAHLLSTIQVAGRVCVAAPTNKAVKVICEKFDAAGVNYVFKPSDPDAVPAGTVIVDTTAGLLGIRPLDFKLDKDGETVKEVFGRGINGGRLNKVNPALLIVDEVSMLSKDDNKAVIASLKETGAKYIAFGDDGQLPPVMKEAIDFSKDFEQGYTLREVVRQAKGSTIIDLAWKVRDGQDFSGVKGGDVVKSKDVVASFLKNVKAPAQNEAERDVFIAYTNKTVNEVQEAACQKLYGHGRRSFAKGELVIASRPGYRAVQSFWMGKPSKFPKMVAYVQNADQLLVESFDEGNRHPVLGVPVTITRLKVTGPERTFSSYYLSDEELADPAHPFNVESSRLLEIAKTFEAEFQKAGGYKKAKGTSIDKQRKQAWAIYADLTKQIVGFAHPFAMTSHKAQGSTYRDAYVATAELLKFSGKALYVAVTRPSRKLYW
jgi:exodeoxyribonuclease-5